MTHIVGVVLGRIETTQDTLLTGSVDRRLVDALDEFMLLCRQRVERRDVVHDGHWQWRVARRDVDPYLLDRLGLSLCSPDVCADVGRQRVS